MVYPWRSLWNTCSGSRAVHQHSNLPGQLHPSEQRAPWLAERRLAGELPVGRRGRHGHPEIINKHLGPDLPSLHEGDRLEPAHRRSSRPSVSERLPSAEQSALFRSKKAGEFATRVTQWTVGNTKASDEAFSSLQTTKLTTMLSRGLFLGKRLFARWDLAVSKTASLSLESRQSRPFKLNC